MLSTLPFPVALILLGFLGAIVGAAINCATYAWASCRHCPISPWNKLNRNLVVATDEEVALFNQRSLKDCIPIVGWFGLRRESPLFWKGHWVRPLAIEIVWMIGLPLFYCWQVNCGLVDACWGATEGLVGFAGETWFWLHSMLIALMFIATFIDFDERTIPDEVTLPGTILALIISAFVPISRLPIESSSRAGIKLESLTFASPNPPQGWHETEYGLSAVLLIFAFWIWGIVPKIVPPRSLGLGIFGSVKMMMASICRPPRKTACAIRIRGRNRHPWTNRCAALFLVGVPVLYFAWFKLSGTANWDSLFGAFIGLAVAGGIIWAIRIVGSFALAEQAMGFGDVTLMYLIGATLGWQASLAGFIYAIFVSLIGSLIILIVKRESSLPFGPYLCIGALIAIFRWSKVWEVGGPSLFDFGPLLLVWLAVGLVFMLILLPIVRSIKIRMIGE